MSYDLVLLRIQPGEDPDEAFERLDESDESVPDEAARRLMEDAAAAVQARFPQLDRHDDDTSIDLISTADSKPYVSLFADEGGASHGEGVDFVQMITAQEERPRGFLRRLFGRTP